MRGKAIIVTGASEGIGHALGRTLAARGARLALAARSQDKLATVARECEALGAETLAVPTDVADETACKALIETTQVRYGAIDALVNNAGISMLAVALKPFVPAFVDKQIARAVTKFYGT